MTKAILLVLLTGIAGCHQDRARGITPDPDLVRFEKTHRAMGVRFQIACYASVESTANKAMSSAFKRIDEIDSRLSNYKSDSEIALLSKNATIGAPTTISDDLRTVLEKSIQVHRQSNGAFDPVIGSLTRQWRLARKRGRLPTMADLELAKSQSGLNKIQLRQAKVVLTAANIAFDFGGIAKGYAADEAIKILEQHGINSAMVDASGDIAFSEPPPGEQGWRVAVKGGILSKADDEAEVLVISNCGVATSGDSRQFVEIDGTRYSHILDPRTGIGITNRCQVTVIAESGMDADAYASAISVLGPADGIKLANQIDGVESAVVAQADKNQTKKYSSQFPTRHKQ